MVAVDLQRFAELTTGFSMTDLTAAEKWFTVYFLQVQLCEPLKFYQCSYTVRIDDDTWNGRFTAKIMVGDVRHPWKPLTFQVSGAEIMQQEGRSIPRAKNAGFPWVSIRSSW